MSDELESWDWERRKEEDRRQVETFRRIHHLYKRGFRPDWTRDVEDALWWRHPGGQPDLLILYADGKLVANLLGRAPSEERRIYNTSTADTAAFDQWLASVKPPTWWQSGKAARERYFVTPMIMAALFLVVGFLPSLIFRQIWQWLFAN